MPSATRSADNGYGGARIRTIAAVPGSTRHRRRFFGTKDR